MNNETNTTWKDWVDWWPTYLIIGISLAHLVNKTQIISKLQEKLFNKKESE